MILTILLLVCTSTSIYAVSEDIPHYHDITEEIVTAERALGEKILSMGGDIPEPEDPRRQYAEIFAVVYYGALYKKDCPVNDYEKFYDHILREYAPIAENEPEKIIDETRKLIIEYYRHTRTMRRLVTELCPKPTTEIKIRRCDQSINVLISNSGRYGTESKIFMAAAEAARALNSMKMDFEEAANDQTAHQYLVNGADKMEPIIESFTTLLSLLYGKDWDFQCENL